MRCPPPLASQIHSNALRRLVISSTIRVDRLSSVLSTPSTLRFNLHRCIHQRQGQSFFSRPRCCGRRGSPHLRCASDRQKKQPAQHSRQRRKLVSNTTTRDCTRGRRRQARRQARRCICSKHGKLHQSELSDRAVHSRLAAARGSIIFASAGFIVHHRKCSWSAHS